MSKLVITVIMVICMTGWLMGCGDHKVVKNKFISHSICAQDLHQSLYFTGIIQPIKETAMTCPIEAVIETIYLNYGQLVEKGDAVLALNSRALEKQYNETFTDYLKAKDNFDIAQARFNGTQELWDAGLISKNNYVSEKSSLSTIRINLIQSNKKLTEIREQLDDGASQDLSALNIAQFNQVQDELNSHHNVILLKAPVAGILLYPPKASTDKSSRMAVAVNAKAGQVIALIGDVSGIHVEIDIPETDINKIHVGMPALITGAALGKRILKGKIISINTQAISGVAGTSPFFNATVEVRDLSAKQRAVIKIGISVSIELLYDQEKQLLIPIKAIAHVEGKKKVTVQKVDGSLDLREVVTGAATADQVVIERGLKVGERIVYDD